MNRRSHLFCSMVLILMLSFCSSQKNMKPIIWKEVIGQLDARGYHEGTIYYLVDTTLYRGPFKFKNVDAVSGERYTMRYNVNKPTEIEIDYWNPVFEIGEKTYFSHATITKVKGISTFHPKAVVRYSFQVNGTTYKKWVYLCPNYKQIHPNLQDGQQFIIEYWAKDINRVVLHLDKPINDTANAK